MQPLQKQLKQLIDQYSSGKLDLTKKNIFIYLKNSLFISIDNTKAYLSGSLGIETRNLLTFSPYNRWVVHGLKVYWCQK